MTPEHQFLSESFNAGLSKFSNSSLFGIFEAQRKTFDFACVLKRDFSRPLVSQVLWKNFTGIEKDLRTLLHDKNSRIKVYLFKDSLRARAKIEEILTSYRSLFPNDLALKGLKLIPVPGDFDADKEKQRDWMSTYIERCIADDLLFHIAFGNFSKNDLLTFEDHGGLIGLKYAILYSITKSPLLHMPTFKKELGYSTSGPIREALIMLSATGLIKSPRNNIQCFPTIKGNCLLDITRRLIFDFTYGKYWSEETSLLFDCLDVKMPRFENSADKIKSGWQDPVYNLIYHGLHCKSTFGINLLGDIDPANPIFYSNNFIQDIKSLFKNQGLINPDPGFFSDENSLLFESDLL